MNVQAKDTNHKLKCQGKECTGDILDYRAAYFAAKNKILKIQT